MKAIKRIFLLPFGLIYGIVLFIRRYLYNQNLILKRFVFPQIETIAVGNINLGGTGKTPYIKYLISESDQSKIAVLSRGYGRETKGFYEVTQNGNPSIFGDEPCEIKNAFPQVPVFVCENRVEGIKKIIQLHPQIKTIFLDDAFQHLKVKASKYILLCDINNPFYTDLPLPAGLLREFPYVAKYANEIVITKINKNTAPELIKNCYNTLAKYKKKIQLAYYHFSINNLPKNKKYIIVSAIANPTLFENDCSNYEQIEKHFIYSDHFIFSQRDADTWNNFGLQHNIQGIICTQKDFVKLATLQLNIPLYVSDIKIEIKNLEDH